MPQLIKNQLIIWLILAGIFSGQMATSQELLEAYSYPLSHDKLGRDDFGDFFMVNGKKYYQAILAKGHGLPSMMGSPTGTSDGIAFDFQDSLLYGTLLYGFIPYGDSRHPQPVYFRSPEPIVAGKATISISAMGGRYDMIGWGAKGKGTLGYRIVDDRGSMIYNGIISFKGTGPFEIDDSIVEGPFVSLLNDQGATIFFKTNKELKAEVVAGGKTFKGKMGTIHEIEIKGLDPETTYDYTVNYGDNSQTYRFKTAPKPGTRSKFTFSYASDSRSGNGGGERDLGGVNAYIMKKIMALNAQTGVAFMQFTGDMITGYKTYMDEIELEYANWKHAIQPFAHYFPVISGMGNHEALSNIYFNQETGQHIDVDKFPFKTHSAEFVYAKEFVNPKNGPTSEDGASYDPSSTTEDFPPYDENVFYYTYDNVAMVVLNSDYWYVPSRQYIQHVGGNLHGYIMDMQLKWLEKTIARLEKDKDIDHIFVTQHTPMFPNGGHVQDDMWYNGNNDYRPYVAGKRLEKGIIERRDELLEIVVNQSTKVRAVLTGDEHNYCKTEIGPATERYPEVYLPKRIELTRTIYQINNGAAGAPYYAQEQTPWTPFTSGFTTQNALVFFHIEGKQILMEVINPDTLEKVDKLDLTK
ncbi:MAG: metallophosphoesterase family protein [Cyclobacteriaceae bacterium]|nr:metallophosphoesterase family protein [Cyclobacteriaceae bacterium]